MKALGLLAGIGSLLFEAREHGMEVVGNVDTRSYFRTDPAPAIWGMNFDAPLVNSVEELKSTDTSSWYNADVAIGHPPCGSYSRLGGTGIRKDDVPDVADRLEWHRKRAAKKGLVPLFADLVNEYKPKTFALDNLSKLMKVFPEEWWENELPDYRVSFIEIVNGFYGSPQHRKRLWVVGIRGKRSFHFREPSRRLKGPTNTWEAIHDLPWEPWIQIPELTHVHHEVRSRPMGGFWVHDEENPDDPKGGHDRRMIRLMTECALGYLSLPTGFIWPYKTAAGRFTRKAAQARLHMERNARTPSGNETLRHPLSGWPLTIRERARIMGWPDEFQFWDGEFEFDRTNIKKMVKLTGRAVPSEFPRYLIPQLMRYARNVR